MFLLSTLKTISVKILPWFLPHLPYCRGIFDRPENVNINIHVLHKLFSLDVHLNININCNFQLNKVCSII